MSISACTTCSALVDEDMDECEECHCCDKVHCNKCLQEIGNCAVCPECAKSIKRTMSRFGTAYKAVTDKIK